MTQTGKTIALLLLAVLAAVTVAVTFATLVQSPAEPVRAEIQFTRIDAIPAAATSLDSIEGTETLSPAQQAEVQATVDRICEGVTAEVPVMDMADTLVREQGMTDEQARDFVNEVAVERC